MGYIMCKKIFIILFLLIDLLLICTACRPQKSIGYTIENADNAAINKFSELWSEQEHHWIEANKNRFIIFACANDYIPLEFLDENVPRGMGVYVLEQVSKATGLKFKLYENNQSEEWYQLVESFIEGKIEILPTVSYSDENSMFLDFSIPYIQTSLAVISHKDNNIYEFKFDRLMNSEVAIPRGYWLNEYIRQRSGNHAAIYPVNTTKDAFDAVSRKLSDYTICEISIFKYYRELLTNKNLRFVDEIEEKNQIMVGIKKDLPLLKSVTNKVITHIDKDKLIENSIIMPSRNIHDEDTRVIIILLSNTILVTCCLLLKNLYSIIAANKQLSIILQQKRKFIADISHDLKTPLMVTMGYIDTIIDGEISDEHRKHNYLSRIQTAIIYIQTLVNDLFTLSKLDDNLIHLQKEKTYINKQIEKVVSLISIEAKEQNIRLIMDLNATIHTQLEVDPLRIGQVLTNIFHNAIKFTPGGGTISISTKHPDSGGTLISIQDNGLGIPQEDLPYVFDRYFKSRSNHDTKSSGLGLCISKELIIRHGGKIWAESIPGKGSTFFIVLPA